MVLRVNIRSQMRKSKLKNMTDLSYETKIPYALLKKLVTEKVNDKGFDLLDKLKGFFGCKISSLLVESPMNVFDGDAYESISGVVYFLRNKDTGMIKIGFTTDLINRIYNLSLEYGADMELIHYISTYDSSTLESVFHNMFADKWDYGEWFNLTDEDIRRVKGECKKI
jgi:DNA-binding Xre family transcriptional regulator